MFQEPLPRRHDGRLTPSNPYEGRWRWWYARIADEMIANPAISLKELAQKLGKAETTISSIRTSSMFLDYFSQRRAALAQLHDAAIRDKLTRAANLSLESVIDHLEVKKGQIPLNAAREVMESALDRLGYNPKTNAGTNVNVNIGNSVTNNVVTAELLLEAQDAIRRVERLRSLEPEVLPPPVPAASVVDGDAKASRGAAFDAATEKLLLFTEAETGGELSGEGTEP